MTRDRMLLACGAIGPLLFVVVFLIEGATRPDYSAFQHPVSSLELGEYGWMQRANFLVTGSLVAAFAVGVRRCEGTLWGPLLIGLIGVGLIGAGIYAADPMSGYPPATPALPERTIQGKLHDAFSALVFLGLPVGCFVFARRGGRTWAVYSIVTGIAFLVGFVLTSMGFAQHPTFMPVGGLLQRLTLVIGFTWIAVLALRLSSLTR
jgi:hypothetical protein